MSIGNYCDKHGMVMDGSCWLCEVQTKNSSCAKGCTAGTDAYYCTESPPGGDCPCKCHATGDQDVW